MDDALAEGCRNLLLGCARIEPGMRVAVVAEDPALGWYDDAAPAAVAAIAEQLGGKVSLVPVGAPRNEPNDDALAAVDRHDCTVFFSRIGDQNRFETSPAEKTVVMSYARTASDLASLYGRLDHAACLALKEAVNGVLFNARSIEITCPHGTDLSGSADREALAAENDVGVRRFPMGVHQPLSAAGFNGTVVLDGYLTPTGSRLYEPACLTLEEPVRLQLTGDRWQAHQGNEAVLNQVENHYRHVAELFDLDPRSVDSWHAGLHPGCRFRQSMHEDPDLWSNSVFTSPRFLHFHTCAAGPPGEICWMIANPTIRVDGTALWQVGVLDPRAIAETRAVLAQHPSLDAAFNACPVALSELGCGAVA